MRPCIVFFGMGGGGGRGEGKNPPHGSFSFTVLTRLVVGG